MKQEAQTAIPLGVPRGRDGTFSSPILATARLSLYVLLTLVLIPVQLIAIGLRLPLRASLPRFYHRLVAWIMGIRLTIEGKLSDARPTLFITNHASYLDIEIAGAVLPGSFVAMAEIRGWPGLGVLARLQRSVFVDRQARTLGEQMGEINARLEAGENVIMFPEGGSYTGLHLLPFRSSLFAVAQQEVRGQSLTVQPLTLVYETLDGKPLGRHWRRFFAWNGQPEIFSHMFYAAGIGSMGVRVVLHEPRTIEDYAGDRKALCAACYEEIQGTMSQVFAGHYSGRA